MKKAFLFGVLFGVLLIPISTLGLVSSIIEILTTPLVTVPKMLFLGTMQTSELPAIHSIVLLVCISAVLYGLIALGLFYFAKKTSKKFSIGVVVIAYFLTLFGGLRVIMQAPQQFSLPEGNTGFACTIHDDCSTPMEYLVRSICPFSSMCIEGTCSVVCPITRHPTSGEKFSVSVACKEDSECDCSDYSLSTKCGCVDDVCVAIME